MISGNPERQRLLATLPSVDELLKSSEGAAWLAHCQRRLVVQAVREAIAGAREEILSLNFSGFTRASLIQDIDRQILKKASFSLRHVINATGIVLHTNLGRSVLSERMLQNVAAVSSGYSNLEYDLEAGERGKRYVHTKNLIRDITGAEDAFIVNNNAAAVLLCLNTLARNRQVIVSRGELVEIGGSFRVPDVMTASSAQLCEVGTTNKTHLHDYCNAVTDQTALLLKVHQSNYRITGFTKDVPVAALVDTGKRLGLPVMYDLGSGCLIDLRAYGIHSEPSVKEIVSAGVDLVTFSGDKLLGGPQGGIIVGKKKYIEQIQKNPLARALRVDKMTIAAFESVFMSYLDEKSAVSEIPVLRMLLQSPDKIRGRAVKLANRLRKYIKQEQFEIVKDNSKAGGGSLPEIEFPTYAVSIKPVHISVNELERRLRAGTPPIIARIKGSVLLLDARTITDREVEVIASAIAASFYPV
ncbi:MAG: L-seryl-tRNA(Sec) selenium transferase [Thermodesulfovibrio sp.]|nr:L-seryl-tRNA(Sec) selenium transferase [Thermodesulfovibrio sp.]